MPNECPSFKVCKYKFEEKILMYDTNSKCDKKDPKSSPKSKDVILNEGSFQWKHGEKKRNRKEFWLRLVW